MKFLLTLLSFLFVNIIGISQTKVADVFGDHMVLQQQSNASIWGTDKPNQKIKITTNWKKRVEVITDNQGKWKTKISTPKAGGPYELKIKGSSQIIIKDVLIGEVWFCSGQSNMEMSVKGFRGQPISGSLKAILEANNPNIRLLNVGKNYSHIPQDTIAGNWSHCTEKNVKEFSTVAYFFGKKLQEKLNVPIGLIHSSWGGSMAETWIDKEKLTKDFPEIKLPNQELTSEVIKSMGKRIPIIPTALYNGMINPFVTYTIRGAIWYQGESDRLQAEKYKKIFPAMISNWRDKWQQGDFPFYFVQIAPFKYNGPDKLESVYLREAQLYASENVKNTEMVVTLDIGDCVRIHPPKKKEVGNRLSYIALNKTYGQKNIPFTGPVYHSLQIIKNKAIIKFKNCEDGIFIKNNGAKNFEVAGEDKVFYPADARVLRDLQSIEVSSRKVENPVAVRYGFKNCVEGNLINSYELPASSFRTDNW